VDILPILLHHRHTIVIRLHHKNILRLQRFPLQAAMGREEKLQFRKGPGDLLDNKALPLRMKKKIDLIDNHHTGHIDQPTPVGRH